MSERTLVGSLLDFGNSFWSSSALREEWPGLESSGLQPIGKFGIGFFSVFVLGNKVRVASRRYDAAVADARVLEFTSILKRPLLRNASPDELPPDYNTRISVSIQDEDREDDQSETEDFFFDRGDYSTFRMSTAKLLKSTFSQVVQLVSPVDVQIEIKFDVLNRSHIHRGNWSEIGASEYLDEVLAQLNDEDRKVWRTAHLSQLRNLTDSKGNNYGRASLAMYTQVRGHSHAVRFIGGVSVGGFFTPYKIENWFVGVMKGDTEDAARRKARTTVPRDVLIGWLNEQASLIDAQRFSLPELLNAARTIRLFGGGLPLNFHPAAVRASANVTPFGAVSVPA
jgi:hypothetical protein